MFREISRFLSDFVFNHVLVGFFHVFFHIRHGLVGRFSLLVIIWQGSENQQGFDGNGNEDQRNLTVVLQEVLPQFCYGGFLYQSFH